MYSQNDTLNSMQNSTINITQLMTTTTTSNRRSRFVNPSQTNPAPEDEDIYVSLQVLQAQLSFSKHEDQKPISNEAITKNETQIKNLQSQYQGAQKEIAELKNEMQFTKIQHTESHEKAIFELHKHIEALEIRSRKHDALQEQILALNARFDQYDKHTSELHELRETVDRLESSQQESNELANKYRLEQDENNQLLKRNWILEVENSKLKKAITKMIQDREDPDMDTVLFPPSPENLTEIRAMLEREQLEKMGHARIEQSTE